jgi:hypothetical protein
MEELQVVTTLAVLQHLMKSVVDFKDSLGRKAATASDSHKYLEMFRHYFPWSRK